ncbi:hypothetical protein RHGRI_005144 [Rhododendron griersonianum]|uniref:Uncharacterized protein n=1 Tax=Rhododendron griersonianum TaxID=479676 RepID=A0AAV6LED8_9ERIC|nr:hypothetical protein RHGRI_005144 [Rhododendron griersonianum]
MPLWKKAAKCNRISKLVSDHIHSPHKRGGSLVVETGFPTSLVDLFVKNRDRLKKPSKKKKKSDQESIPMPNSPSVSPVSENSELGLPSVRINLASEKVNWLNCKDTPSTITVCQHHPLNYKTHQLHPLNY